MARRIARNDFFNLYRQGFARLAELGLIERRPDGGVAVAWDVIRAEFRL